MLLERVLEGAVEYERDDAGAVVYPPVVVVLREPLALEAAVPDEVRVLKLLERVELLLLAELVREPCVL